LRYLNYTRFGFKNEIHSVRHALAILGDREVRCWVQLIAPVGAGQKTSDLVLCALVRARFGQLVTPLTRHGQADLLLLGPLFMLDVMLEMPMSDIVKKILLDSEAKAVLRGGPIYCARFTS
jgi:EAL and modified HD-GYP domain-containing signal transduction protein